MVVAIVIVVVMLTRSKRIVSSRMMRYIDNFINTTLRQNIKILNTAILGEKVALQTLTLWGNLPLSPNYFEYREIVDLSTKICVIFDRGLHKGLRPIKPYTVVFSKSLADLADLHTLLRV